MSEPIRWIWDGECMSPAGAGWARKADKLFVVGEGYFLVEHHDRSSESHRHYFACLREVWANLPEEIADQYPSPESLRKKLLIKAGYADEQSFVANSKAEAIRLAAFLRPIDDYSIVTVSGTVVTRYTAKSQSQHAMGKKDFQASKQAVLDLAASLIGVSAETLSAEARRAA